MTNIDVLYRAMCKAYSRNSGNYFKEHLATRAATIWMKQALEEVGVAELIEAAKEVEQDMHTLDMFTTRLTAALARIGGAA